MADWPSRPAAPSCARWRPPPGATSRRALERAARELLALQSSDWAFQVTRDLAADYPLERVAAMQPHSTPPSAPCETPPSCRIPPCATWPPTWTSPRWWPHERVLILSWEYPPLIEGGLARHVRKLAENLVAQGMEVHVLARGTGGVARRGGDGRA